jgi:hypothetical protein
VISTQSHASCLRAASVPLLGESKHFTDVIGALQQVRHQAFTHAMLAAPSPLFFAMFWWILRLVKQPEVLVA